MNPCETPYATWALRYRDAGWSGVLPLPPGQKASPPDGYTGAQGVEPSTADIYAWAEERPNANLALRLPSAVIGLDIDTYGGKQGAATVAQAVARWGELPPTFSSTAREPGSGSGIFLYQVPAGLRWPGQVGPHVEIIQHRHRYMVAPPSLHPTGRIYQWYGVGWMSLEDRDIPTPERLARLPREWVDGLSALASVHDVEKGAVGTGEMRDWLAANSGQPCRIMFARMESVLSELVSGNGSRHDIALNALMAFAHLSREGHRGATYASSEVHHVWDMLVTAPGEGSRNDDQATAEWHRMLSGAVAMYRALEESSGIPGIPDPCTVPLASLLVGQTESAGRVSDPARPAQSTSDWSDDSRHTSGVPAPSDAPSAPPGQGAGVTVSEGPPDWVIQQVGGATLAAGQTESDARSGQGIPGQGGAAASVAVPLAEAFDRHGVAVALEVERLEVRRDARLELIRSEHVKTWREPPGYTLRQGLLRPDVPVHWRVDDVMPEGANVLLVAQYKTGKTTLVNELTKALADGQAFLGHYKIPQCANVALFNYEVGEAQYLRWLRDRGIDNADGVHVLNVRGFTLPVSVPLVRNFVTEWLRSREIRVWIVDPFARAFSGGGDENSNTDVAPFLEILDGIKEEAGVSELVMPTHTGRAEMAIGSERARGATRLDDWCDVRWLLTKDDEGNRYFRATGRDVETEETKLEYDPITRALSLGTGARPPRSGRGGGRGGYGAQNGAHGRAGPLEDVVLEALRDKPGMGKVELREAVRGHGGIGRNLDIDDAVRRLLQQARIRVDAVRQAQGGRPLIAHYATGGAPNEGE